MARFRVLLAGIPRMLQEIVETTLRGQPDMHIVGALQNGGANALAAALHATATDVVILGLDTEARAAAYESLLFDHCRVRLVAIVGDGREAFVYELRPNRVPIAELTADELLDVIRTGRQIEVS